MSILRRTLLSILLLAPTTAVAQQTVETESPEGGTRVVVDQGPLTILGMEVMHGFRIGYGFVTGAEDSEVLKNPHLFVIGIQLGAGVTVLPFDPTERYLHMVMGVGYTPKVGSFNVPIHASFIPDVEGHWRAHLTTGVNW